jgi:hypothetical protein
MLVVVAVLVWAAGLYLLVDGRYVLGGALIVAGGLGFVVAATRGWGELAEGVSNWLYFWR